MKDYVKLRNNFEISSEQYNESMNIIRKLRSEPIDISEKTNGPLIFLEVINRVNNPLHIFDVEVQEKLTKLGFLDHDGFLDTGINNIVSSMVQYHEGYLVVTSPRQESQSFKLDMNKEGATLNSAPSPNIKFRKENRCYQAIVNNQACTIL